MKRKYWVIAGIAMYSVLILALYLNKVMENDQIREELTIQETALNGQLQELREDYESIANENKMLQVELQETNEAREEVETQNKEWVDASKAWLQVDDFTKERLKEQGVDDYTIILDNLMERADVIPVDGVLGGTMHFTKVYLVNHHWAYGLFEDGHILGSGIFEYSIDDEGNISWECIASYMD